METRTGGGFLYFPDYNRSALRRRLRDTWRSRGLRGLLDATVVTAAAILVNAARRSAYRRGSSAEGSSSIRLLSFRESLFCRGSAAPLGLRLVTNFLRLRGARVVEIPVAKSFAAAHSGQRVAEIGNVLGYYTVLPANWTVFDKYEWGGRIQRVDVLAITGPPRFDAVLSISTLEHVGWDEANRDPESFLAAVQAVRSLVAPGGEALVTLPLHYNPVVDRWAFSGPPPGFSFRFLAPTRTAHAWSEIDAERARTASRCVLIGKYRAD